MRIVSCTFGVLLAVLMAAPANAATESELLNIRKFAQMKCGGCHVIDKQQPEFVAYRGAGTPPSFSTLAHDPAMTPEKLRRALRLPGGNMANLLLTKADIEDLITYIDSLRTP